MSRKVDGLSDRRLIEELAAIGDDLENCEKTRDWLRNRGPKALVALQESLGISQRELAKQLKVAHTYLSNIAQRKRRQLELPLSIPLAKKLSALARERLK